MGGRARLAAIGLICCVGLLCLGAGQASANSLLVPNLNWTALLPPLPGTPADVQPGPVPNCQSPSIACIDNEIQRMTQMQARLGCDHRAVFDTTYLELTKVLRGLLDTDPGLVQDRNYLYTEDALFADFYFDTLSAWNAGRTVAPAWRIAFNKAAHGELTGAQDMLLGIN